jgi:hypothetical protein
VPVAADRLPPTLPQVTALSDAGAREAWLITAADPPSWPGKLTAEIAAGVAPNQTFCSREGGKGAELPRRNAQSAADACGDGVDYP